MELLRQLPQFILAGITVGSIYAIIALGFSLIYSATGIINFAQGEFVMLGAMLSVALLGTKHFSLPEAVCIAVVLTGALGALLGKAAVHRLKKSSPISLIIVTIGASTFFKGCAMLAWGSDSIPLPAFSSGDSIIVGEASIQPQTIWILGITALMLLAVFVLSERTIFGKAMKASAVNKHGAALVGIDINKMVVWAFSISASLGAVGGAIVAPITMASFDMGMMLGLKGFCAAILGGLGSIGGAIAGGLVLGIVEALGAGYISSEYKDAIAFVILLAILLVRPSGLFSGGSRDDR